MRSGEKMAIAYIGLGSNLGDSNKAIETALNWMEQSGLIVIKVASIIKTPPYGGVDQPDFSNTVCSVETNLPPLKLLETLKEIERKMGRTPTVRWGPRLMDLDILLYDDLVMKSDSLIIPHADMLNRLFVLEPLVEIAGDLLHPISGKAIREELGFLKQK